MGELTRAFCAKVPGSPVLGPVFAGMSQDHAGQVADFIDEVFGGPTAYTGGGGSHARMIAHHLGRALTETQRRRWFDLMLKTVDQAGLPTDPEFRAALVKPGLRTPVPLPIGQRTVDRLGVGSGPDSPGRVGSRKWA